MDSDILKLGLLHELVGDSMKLEEEEIFVSFEHKTLQEFSAADHITKRLEKLRDVNNTLDLKAVKVKIYVQINKVKIDNEFIIDNICKTVR